jgi:hypothetical protein
VLKFIVPKFSNSIRIWDRRLNFLNGNGTFTKQPMNKSVSKQQKIKDRVKQGRSKSDRKEENRRGCNYNISHMGEILNSQDLRIA